MTDRPGAELDTFEERLLAELKAVVAAQSAAAPPTSSSPYRSRAPRRWYVPAVGAAAAAVAIALVATTARPTPAFAVSGTNGEEVTVTVTRLEGAEALERELRARGVPSDVTYLPTDKACERGRYAEVRTPGLSLQVGADLFEVTIPPGAIGAENTFVLSAAVTPTADGVRAIVEFGIAQGAVDPCTVVDAQAAGF
jgi:hypothetical protein